MVGHHIEISNRFLHDFEATITIAKQRKETSALKGRFGGIVYMTEDSNCEAVARIHYSADQRSSNILNPIRATSIYVSSAYRAIFKNDGCKRTTEGGVMQ